MVNRKTFERELINIVAPAVSQAQDIMESKYGIRFEVEFNWQLTKGHFDDEEQKTKIGG